MFCLKCETETTDGIGESSAKLLIKNNEKAIHCITMFILECGNQYVFVPEPDETIYSPNNK